MDKNTLTELKNNTLNAYISALNISLSVAGLLDDNGGKMSKPIFEMLVFSSNLTKSLGLSMFALYADSYNA